MKQTTIREALEEKMQARAKARLEKLQANDAPRLLIQLLKRRLNEGNFTKKVGKIEQFGGLAFIATENKEYRRGLGVVFTIEDGSKVYLIPGPYGVFLTNETTQ